MNGESNEEICKVCGVVVKEGVRAVGCDGPCGRWFHCNCINMSKNEYEMLVKYSKTVIWMCSEDKLKFKLFKEKINYMGDINIKFCDLVNKNELLMKEMMNLKTKIEDLQKSNEVIIKNVSETDNKMLDEIMKIKENKQSYAEIIKNDPPILVRPKIIQDSKVTINEVKNKVDPVKLKIINVAKKTKGVVALLSKEKDMESVKKAVEESMGDDYEIKVSALIKPRITVHGFENLLDEVILVDKIKEQNVRLKDAEIKCIKINKNGKRNNYMALLEVDSDSYHIIMNMEKLNIEWVRCPVYDGIDVKRCFKCLSFNHNANECRNGRVCKNCKGDHDIKVCNNSKMIICTNCMRVNEKMGLNLNTNHDVMSRECPVYERKIQMLKKKINFIDTKWIKY